MSKGDIHDLDWVEKALSEPFAQGDVPSTHMQKATALQDGSWLTTSSTSAGTPMFWSTLLIFLYRHYVELQFKRLIPDAAFLVDTVLDEKDRETLTNLHRLDQLWSRLKPLLQKASFGVNADEIGAIEAYVRQLCKIDEVSFSFRYPTTKSGAPSIDHQKLPHINIGVFAACMERLTAYLYGLGHSKEIIAVYQ